MFASLLRTKLNMQFLGYIKSRVRLCSASIDQQHQDVSGISEKLKMKFVLIFMMSVLVVITHQYFPDQRVRAMPWWSPYSPQSYIEKYEPFIDHYSAPIPSIYSSQDLPWENLQRNAHFVYVDSTEGEENMDNHPNFADVQSRGKVSLLPEELSPRFFFGTSATITNPFLKTATFTVSSTVTATTAVKCLTTGEFVAGGSTKACRRKRRVVPELLGTYEDQMPITPSEPQLLTATTLPPVNLMQGNRQRLNYVEQGKHYALDSSKGEVDDISGSTYGKNLKEKRFIFLYNKNAFVVSTTVTTFKFVSVTTKVTIDLAVNDNALNCLPTGYVVC